MLPKSVHFVLFAHGLVLIFAEPADFSNRNGIRSGLGLRSGLWFRNDLFFFGLGFRLRLDDFLFLLFFSVSSISSAIASLSSLSKLSFDLVLET